MTSAKPLARRAQSVLPQHSRVKTTSTAIALVALCGLFPGQHVAEAAERGGYEILPLSSDIFQVTVVSGDGKVVAGHANSRAVRWSLAGGVQTININGRSSYANATNGDGSVVVGYYLDQHLEKVAYRWTEAGSVVLQGLWGDTVANGVSADGSVVVGRSEAVYGESSAVRWDGTALTVLDSLGGINNSARAISDDGLTVVGESSYVGGAIKAVRWIGSNVYELGSLGGDSSTAYDVNSDGSVIVGYGYTSNFYQNAFRWTVDGMENLGTLGGTDSFARAVSSDGSVVVGHSYTADNATIRAFRWTAETDMISIEDWLRANGVTVESDFARLGLGVSDDGNVVVGTTDSYSAFIARVSDYGSGIIDLEQYMATLAGRPSATQIGVSIAGTTMNGAHGEPMRNLLDVGRQSLQMTTDVGYDNGRRSDGGVVISDFTYGLGLEGGITARLSAGGLYTKQDMDAGGDFKYRGFHIAPEVTLPVVDGLYATIGGYYSAGKIDINRGYLNGGVMDYSRGDADFDTWGAKLRFDWLNAFRANDWNFTPYTSLTYANARMDGYDEQGGGFATSFNSVRDHSTVLRVGFDAVTDVSERVRLLGKIEADYRFEKTSADVTGTIGGFSDFTLAGQDIDQFWLRGGFGAEFDTKAGTAFLSLNASTQGDDPTVWVKTGWKVVF
jgi:probable HAF family extracellular repeat protein